MTCIQISVGALLLLTQCRFSHKQTDPKPIPVLPPATQQGANTVGFLVNDTVWLPRGSWNREELGGYYNSRGSFVLFGTYVEPGGLTQQSFGLTIGNARAGAGTYSLYMPLGVDPIGRVSGASFSRWGKLYETNTRHPGTVTITRLDSVQRIVSGTFQFTPVDRRAGDSIRIRQGRFDLHY